MLLSSLATTALNGRVGLKSTEFIGFDVPIISPTLVPVSALKTCPNLKHNKFDEFLRLF
jgi:hypothetical protein